MGNSRVMFIAAISAVLGLYTLGIKRADSQVQAIPLSHAYKMQAKEIAKSGVGVALQKIIKNGKWIEQATALSVMGGTLNYTAVNFSSYGYNWAYVYVSGQYKHQTVNAYAWVEQVKAKKWVIKQFSTVTGNSNEDFAGLEQFSN